MRPNFALNLSHDGITLLHRSPRGTWVEVGDIALDDANFRENLSFLRGTAVALEGKGFGSKLIIPDSQILYREVIAPGPSEAERLSQIKEALRGQTPYEVDDLSFDWREIETGVHVAVVAKDTLDEAEGFAVDHRFNPLSFTAAYSDEAGDWEPFFGRTDYAVSMLGIDADVRDTPLPAPPIEAVAPQVDSIFAEDDFEEPESESAGYYGDDTLSEDPEADVFERYEMEISEANEQVQDEPADAPVETPAFSSRRQLSTSPPSGEADRPLSRIPARIVIGKSPPIQPVQDADLKISPAQLMGELEPAKLAENKMSAQQILGRLTTFGSQTVGLFTSKWRDIRKKSHMPTKQQPPVIDPSGFAAAQQPFDVESTPIATAPVQTGKKKPILSSVLQQSRAQIATVWRQFLTLPRRILMSGIAAVAVIAVLFGLYLALFSSDVDPRLRSDSGQGDLENASALAGISQAPGAEDRTRARPADLNTSVASTNATAQDVPANLASNRPEPRNALEGGVDPDAGQPDTVNPVTSLTDQERADIASAGLSAPTAEEIAEVGAAPSGLHEISPEQVADLYAQSGILQGILPTQTPNVKQFRDDIFVPEVDKGVGLSDTPALPEIETSRLDVPLGLMLSPLSADISFDLDERGLVTATVKGTIAPSGVLIFAGKPVITPPVKPYHEIVDPISRLAAIRPKFRPLTLKTGEDAIFVQGRMTLSQLRKKKPKARPVSEQILQKTNDGSPTELAVLTSVNPVKRPSDFSDKVAKIRAAVAAAQPAQKTNTAPTPSDRLIIPTRASVAKLATTTNALDKSRLNLIGVYGTATKRRALLRLPSGSYVKVEIGDRIDGGRVASIGVSSLNYVKSGRNRVLKIPD